MNEELRERGVSAYSQLTTRLGLEVKSKKMIIADGNFLELSGY